MVPHFQMHGWMETGEEGQRAPVGSMPPLVALRMSARLPSSSPRTPPTTARPCHCLQRRTPPRVRSCNNPSICSIERVERAGSRIKVQVLTPAPCAAEGGGAHAARAWQPSGASCCCERCWEPAASARYLSGHTVESSALHDATGRAQIVGTRPALARRAGRRAMRAVLCAPPCTTKVAPPITAPSGSAANIFLHTRYRP